MVSNPTSDELALKALTECKNLQFLIDANRKHLDKLRAPTLSKRGHFTPTSALTKTEIRRYESKLIEYFSKQLTARNSLTQAQWLKVADKLSQYPSLSQWLSVVGVTAESAGVIETRIANIQKDPKTSTLDILKGISDNELRKMLIQLSNSSSDGLSDNKVSAHRKEDHRRLSCALDHLRKYTNLLIHEQTPSSLNMNLFWDSWWDKAADVAPSHGHPLNIPRSHVASISGYHIPITPTSISHNTGADSTDSVASSLSSGGSSIPPPSPGDVLFTDQRNIVREGAKSTSSPPTTPPFAMPHKSSVTSIKTTNIYDRKMSASIHQNLVPKDYDSLVMPPPSEHHKDIHVKNQSFSRGSESMQNIHGSEVSISYSPSVGSDFYTGPSTMSCQKIPPTNEKLSNYAWVEGATVMTQSVCRSTSSYISNNTSVTTSTKAPMASECSDASGGSINDKISNSMLCQSPIPHTNSRRHEKSNISTHHTGPEELNSSSTFSNIGPSPAASPKSPFTHQEANYLDSATVDSKMAPTLQVPKSPRTPSMGHRIRHRFIKKTLYKPSKCDFCSGTLFRGLKCKECKFKCHHDCEQNVPDSCGLPEEMVKYYFNHLSKENSPILTRTLPESDRASTYSRSVTHVAGINPHHPNKPWPDSSSNTSSCNSSTPSSPNVILDSTPNPTPPHSASMYTSGVQFTFPNPGQNSSETSLHCHPSQSGVAGSKLQHDSTMIGTSSGCHTSQQNFNYNSHHQLPQTSLPQVHPQNPRSPNPGNPLIVSIQSNDSDKTLSNSSGSQGTSLRMDSQDSTEVEWGSSRQPSISLREWDIPIEDLKIGQKIGSGQFSTVHQGNWHGDIAIKFLNMESTEDEATLEAFRKEVATFRKTRHENLILFMGACMNPPKLAIVTSLCKGDTLYTILHLKRDKFPMSKIKIIAEQIAQGMSYLHHRGIVHKDLKSKNIFFERGKAIITDFGLVNVARRLCARQKRVEEKSKTVAYERDCMSIPEGWLCYLAPEIMRTLRVRPDEDGEQSFTQAFTKKSDVYAFGTIWFELLTGEFSWKQQPPETIIWMVGRGMKPSLANLQASKDVKDILVMCWTFKPEARPDFSILHNYLEKIPSKRLARSPSHPVQILSRSVESVF